MPAEQLGIEQRVVASDELVERGRGPPLPVDRYAAHPRSRDRRVELVRRTVGGCDLADRVGNMHARGFGLAILQVAPRQLDVLTVSETVASGEDLAQDRVSGHPDAKATP